MFVAHLSTVPEASQWTHSFAKSLKIAQGVFVGAQQHPDAKRCLTCMRGSAVSKAVLLDMELNHSPPWNTVHGQSKPYKWYSFVSFSHQKQRIDILQAFQYKIKNSLN